MPGVGRRLAALPVAAVFPQPPLDPRLMAEKAEGPYPRELPQAPRGSA